MSAPSYWTLSTLDMAGIWGSGGTPKKSEPAYYDGEIPWLVIGDLNDGYVSKAAITISESGLANSSARLVPPGTILIAMYGSIGKMGLTTIECATNQAIAYCRPYDGFVDTKYLFYYLRSQRDQLLSQGKGGAQQNISQTVLKAYEFALSPLAEQKQIAAILDELLAQVDTLKTRLDAIPAILKRFRQSVLAAAVSGRLTKEWRISKNSHESGCELVEQAKKAHRDYWLRQQVAKFEKTNKQPKNDKWKEKYEHPELPELTGLPELPANWAYACAETIVEPGAEIVYGIVQPGPKLSEGVPYVRGTDIQDGKILVNQLLFTSQVIADKYQRAALKGSDILLGIIRATKVAIVPDCLDGANITQGTARLRASKFVKTRYLAYCLESPKLQAWLHRNYRGIDMPGLNLKDVRKTPIPLPLIEEQDEIVRRVDQLLAFADQIGQRVKDAQCHVNHLTQSILAKAFRGELTVDWREQNPDLISGMNSAEALLNKIKAVHLSASSKKRTRKTRA